MNIGQKYIKNICMILKFQFQCPGMGNGIALLRDLQKLKLHNEKEANIELFRISNLSDKVVAIRNSCYHGIMPVPDIAESEFRDIIRRSPPCHKNYVCSFLGLLYK